MTVVAINAVVDVSAHPVVFCIRRWFRMAVRTLKDRVVACIGVASGTNTISAAMIGGEPGVIEGCIEPTGGRVTCPAGGWESGGDMVRTRRGLVNRLVARVAIAGGVGVVVVNVALRAWNIHMGSGQGKSRVVMVEGRWTPSRRGVTKVALLGEARGYMVRLGGASVVLNMAGHTSCRRTLKFSSDMACCAVQLGMHSCQGVSGQFQVVKFGAEPGVDGVALLAG